MKNLFIVKSLMTSSVQLQKLGLTLFCNQNKVIIIIILNVNILIIKLQQFYCYIINVISDFSLRFHGFKGYSLPKLEFPGQSWTLGTYEAVQSFPKTDLLIGISLPNPLRTVLKYIRQLQKNESLSSTSLFKSQRPWKLTSSKNEFKFKLKVSVH